MRASTRPRVRRLGGRSAGRGDLRAGGGQKLYGWGLLISMGNLMSRPVEWSVSVWFA